MPLDLTHEGLNTPNNLRLYLSLAEISLGIATQTLGYNDVRRILTPSNGETAAVKGDSELGRVLVEDAKGLCAQSDVIVYLSGLATLFETGSLQRSLAPKCLLCWDLRDSSKLVGIANCCYFAVEDALGTASLTTTYCAQHGLPTFTDYYFLDVFCSVRSPAGSLLIVNALMIASRQRSRKPPGLCAVAINERSLKTFKKLNFNIHEFKSHGQKRHLCWIRIDEFKLEPLLARLKFANNEYLVRNICFRKGATAASEHKVMKNGC
ncbi:MAG: hypothetical protein VXU50_06925 [Verrucomicrobiota bacterium]|jgi:hypothetical protein|nr:hypothetical protein [Verrucomicrobiota bacterium]